MPGVPRELAEHRIDINEGSKPVKQRLRRFSPDKKVAIKKEITKLMAAGFIRQTAQACDLIPNLAATFVNLRRFNIKLNPKKCVFGFPKGKLLGYIVSERGIEANP